jgi:hypothetical protein
MPIASKPKMVTLDGRAAASSDDEA